MHDARETLVLPSGEAYSLWGTLESGCLNEEHVEIYWDEISCIVKLN